MDSGGGIAVSVMAGEAVLSGVGALMTELSVAFRLGNRKGDLAARIERVVGGIEALVRADIDAALAAIVHVHKHGYVVSHSVHAALLVEALGQSLRWTVPRRRSVVAGALTMNVAAREVQDELAEMPGEVDARYWAWLLRHPKEGVRRLREAGVRDGLWLGIVARHHERADGSGYPAGLRRADLQAEVRAVALADLYCALASGRGARPRVAGEELRERFLERAVAVDGALGQFLVRWIGLYPPGTCVDLADGETVVVVRRPAKGAPAHCPRVRAIRSARGEYLADPPWRDTQEESKRIVRVLHALPPGFSDPVERLWAPPAADGTRR